MLRCLSMMMTMTLGLWMSASPASAQISPPGLGAAKTASWTALGLRQDLDSEQRRESVTYVGLGTISNPDNVNPLERPSIFVLNQEFYDRFNEHFAYSIALSYRRQNLYESRAPYGAALPSHQHELRLYGRFSHVWKRHDLKLVNTFRPELRTFYAPSPGPDERIQLRFRLRSQLNWTIDAAARNHLIGSGEALFSVGNEHGSWSEFNYRESRFCFYYSRQLERRSVVIDIGYMNNLLGNGRPLVDVHYFAINVVWDNPFGTPRGERQLPTEYLE